MNSRVPWSVEAIDPSVRERAEAAALRAGMSLNDWLNSTLGNSAPANSRNAPDPRPTPPSQESRDVADIHQRLDSITRQIEQISRPAPRNDEPRIDEAALQLGFYLASWGMYRGSSFLLRRTYTVHEEVVERLGDEVAAPHAAIALA